MLKNQMYQIPYEDMRALECCQDLLVQPCHGSQYELLVHQYYKNNQ